MGIRGLFTYIQTNVEGSLEWHKLYNCNLVIDGNNLAYDIYNSESSINFAFGGDYDKYATCVEEFFRKLLQCNLTPYVIMDGGYEVQRDKFETVYTRMKQQIYPCLKITPDNQRSTLIFPIMARAVFVNVIQKLGVNVLQCDFEADDEIAVIAKELDAYVLSNDSDFYLFGVRLIKLNSLNMSSIQKETNEEGSCKFIPCYRFDIKTFSKITRVRGELLPLLAPILGNDYMDDHIMKNFYSKIKHYTPNSKASQRHKLIGGVIRWLSDQKGSPEEVLEKILGLAKLSSKREKLVRRVFEMYFPSKSNLRSWVQPHASSCPTLKGVKSVKTYASSSISKVDFKRKWFVPPKVKWELDCSCDQRLETGVLYGREMPGWFIRAFRLHLIPPLVADILNKNYLFILPQIEEYQRPCIYAKLEPIINGIRAILWLTLDQSLSMTKKPSVERPREKENSKESQGFFLQHLRKNKSELADKEVEMEQDEESEEEEETDEETEEEEEDEEERVATNGTEEEEMEVDNDSRRDSKVPKKVSKEQKRHTNSNLQSFLQTRKIPLLRVYMRKGYDLLGRNFLPESIENFRGYPSLFEVERFSSARKKEAFFKLIGTSIVFEEDLPPNINFILICICYWRALYSNHVDDKTLLSVLACLLMFCVIDGKAGRVRSKSKFGATAVSDLKRVKELSNEGKLPDASSLSVKDLIQSLTLEEIRIANISLFQFHVRSPTESKRPYDRIAVHAFSEFQATVYFLQILNSLLCFPFPSISIESFWSGTFCYNIHKCFSAKVDFLDILSTIFGGNTRIIELFVKLYNVLETYLELPELKGRLSSIPKEKQSKVKSIQRKKLGLKSLNSLGVTTKLTSNKKSKRNKKMRFHEEKRDVIEELTEEEMIMISGNKFASLLLGGK